MSKFSIRTRALISMPLALILTLVVTSVVALPSAAQADVGKSVGTALARALLGPLVAADDDASPPRGTHGPMRALGVKTFQLPAGAAPTAPPRGGDGAMDTAAAAAVLFTEDFEGAWPGAWAISGDPQWDRTTYRRVGGTRSAYCTSGGSLGVPAPGPYPNDSDTYLTAGPFDMSQPGIYTLDFWLWLDSESWFDYFQVAASGDGITFNGPMYDGNSGGWVDMSGALDLSPYVGDPSVWITFYFYSDFMITYEGAYVDDVRLNYVAWPNVEPLTPPGWDDTIVASTGTGTNTDTDPIYDDETVYVDMAMTNTGDADVHPGVTVTAELQVDGAPVVTRTVAGMAIGSVVKFEDIDIGMLPAGGHTLRIVTDSLNTVTESDETDNEYQRALTITARPNNPPTTPTKIGITPASPFTDDDLTASVSGSTDADGDTITYFYEWGRSTDGGATYNFAGGTSTWSKWMTDKGDYLKVRARAWDGEDISGWLTSAPVVIANSPPPEPSPVTITPDPAMGSNDLTANRTAVVDADGDAVSYDYQWARSTDGGTTFSNWGNPVSPLPRAKTADGQVWKARVRANDGTSVSAWVESAPVTINSPPTRPTTLTIAPALPDTTDGLVPTAGGGTDPDGTTPTYEYQWNRSQNDRSTWDGWWTGPSATLESVNTAKDDWWKARARSYDGVEYSTWFESSPVKIRNAKPTKPAVVQVSPLHPGDADALNAAASGSADGDGDTITYDFLWQHSNDEGVTWGSWGRPGDTIGAGVTTPGQLWRAKGRASDGTVASAWKVSQSVRINRAPGDPTDVVIAPDPPGKSDTLTAAGSGAVDPDGDMVTYQYQWARKSGVGILYSDWGNTGPTLSGTKTSAGYLWKARARAYDGYLYSNWVESSAVTINTPPNPPAATTILPASPEVLDDLGATATTGGDADGDPLTYTYQWQQSTDSGTTWGAWGNDGPILVAANTTAGELWRARARAYDGLDYGNWTRSTSVEVNTAPTDPIGVKITPASPDSGQDLTGMVSGSTDADGDPLSYDFQWARSTDGGTSWGAWGNDGQTLPAVNTSNDDQWKARAIAYDGTHYSNWVESMPVTIGNAIATFTGPTVSPGTGRPNVNAFRFETVITDVDGQAPSRMQIFIERLEDGKLWQPHTTLDLVGAGGWAGGQPAAEYSTLPNGCYRFRAEVDDDTGAPAVGPADYVYGPSLGAVPQLWVSGLTGRADDFVYPNTGAAGDVFKFGVLYTDSENEDPTERRIQIQKLAKDGTWQSYDSRQLSQWGEANTGMQHTFNRKLPEGEFRHRFVFADSQGPATGADSAIADATQWQPGPTVSAAGTTGGIVGVAALSSPVGAQVDITLSTDASVTARVLNLAGRPVGTVCRAKDLQSGINTLVWNGTGLGGTPVPGGTYLIEVTAMSAGGEESRALAPVTLRR